MGNIKVLYNLGRTSKLILKIQFNYLNFATRYAELENYETLPFQVAGNDNCDIVFDKPTILMKLDAGIQFFLQK